MIILLSPANTFSKLKVAPKTIPALKKDSLSLEKELKKLSVDTIKHSMHLSDKQAQITYQYYQNLSKEHYAAIYTYMGQVYRGLSYASLPDEAKAYLDQRLKIISGLYGILSNHDAISYYRLEMNDRTLLDLHAYWKPKIEKHIKKVYPTKTIVSLLSAEYAKIIEDLPHIQIEFSDQKQIPSMELKTLRGEFVRTLALENVTSIERMRGLKIRNFTFDEAHSTATQFIYRRNAK